MARTINRDSAAYKVGKGIRKTGQASAQVGSAAVSGTDEGIIVLSAIFVFGLGYLSSYVGPKKPNRGRLLVGVAVVYIGLAAMAEFNARLARNFAILIMITALLAEGQPVLTWLLGRSSQPLTTQTPTPAQQLTAPRVVQGAGTITHNAIVGVPHL